jgi:hypothetical protein
MGLHGLLVITQNTAFDNSLHHEHQKSIPSRSNTIWQLDGSFLSYTFVINTFTRYFYIEPEDVT